MTDEVEMTFTLPMSMEEKIKDLFRNLLNRYYKQR